MNLLKETLAGIRVLDQKKMAEAKERLDSLTKPVGSLGKLEEIAIKLAGITGDVFARVDQKVHIIMAADHGVAVEGVSAFSQEVTIQMVNNILNGGAAINVLARQAAAEITIVDIGVAGDVSAEKLINRKIKRGTDNLIKGPAMTREEAVASLETGIEVVNELIDKGANLVGTGEMGIGNTTSSSAILAAITGLPLDEIVGFGSGIDQERLIHKKKIIKEALKKNRPDINDSIDILAKVGGLEIGGMAGVMLGAAGRRVPVLIDGLISGAAALIAQKLAPEITGYFISSHKSVEPGHSKIYKQLGLNPMLEMNMRLGEGTGAILAMNLVEAAARIIKEMATFAEAQVSQSNQC